MTRPLSAGMQAHLARGSHSLVSMLRLDLRDGTKLGFTNHDEDLSFDLGDGPVTFSAGEGVLPSDIDLLTGFEASTYEVVGPIGTLVTRRQLLGGRFNRALAWLFLVDWQDLANGHAPLAAGFISQARNEGGRYILEVATDAALFEQVIGEILTPMCRTYYGSALCGKVPESVVGTVTAVTDELAFTVSYPGLFADDYFNSGTVTPLTGALAGTDPVDIHDWSEAGAVVLFTGLVDDLQVGDTVTLERGCPRTRAACMARDNILNMRAEPEIPGSDQILRPTVPGQGNDDS